MVVLSLSIIIVAVPMGFLLAPLLVCYIMYGGQPNLNFTYRSNWHVVFAVG